MDLSSVFWTDGHKKGPGQPRPGPEILLVGVTGFEPAASWSQTKRATNCATPRSGRIIPKYSGEFNIYLTLRRDGLLRPMSSHPIYADIKNRAKRGLCAIPLDESGAMVFCPHREARVSETPAAGKIAYARFIPVQMPLCTAYSNFPSPRSGCRGCRAR